VRAISIEKYAFGRGKMLGSGADNVFYLRVLIDSVDFCSEGLFTILYRRGYPPETAASFLLRNLPSVAGCWPRHFRADM